MSIGSARRSFANGEFSASADTFVSLAQNFPGSLLRLRAVVEAASARAKLGAWLSVGALLGETGGVFQQAARLEPGDELVLRGRLLLAQAKFEQKNYDDASALLESIHPPSLTPQLEWQRAHLVCQVKLAAGDLSAALAATTNLLQIAQQQHDDGLLADAASLEAKVLALMNRPAEAIAAYREHVTTNAPEKQRQQALLKEAELSLAQGQWTNAVQSLEDFTGQFTNSPVQGYSAADARRIEPEGRRRTAAGHKRFAAGPGAVRPAHRRRATGTRGPGAPGPRLVFLAGGRRGQKSGRF